MSIKIQTQVWDYSKAKGSTLLVLIAIADGAADETREHWATIKHICDKTRLGERGVQQCISDLKLLGELEVTPRFRKNGSQSCNTFKISEYMVGAQTLHPLQQQSEQDSGGGGTPQVGGVHDTVGGGASPRTAYNHPLTVHEPSPKQKESDVEKQLALEPPEKPSSDLVKTIFAYWQEKTKHPGAILDAKRKTAITRALKLGYSAEQLRSAIDGCLKSPWHQGNNDDGKVYDAITLIFRDAEHIERFIGYNKCPPAKKSKYPPGFDENGDYNPTLDPRWAHRFKDGIEIETHAK